MIVGIIGALGAGKGTVAEYLLKHYGFSYLSARNFLAGELSRGGQEVNLEHIRAKAQELRAQHGAGYIIEQLLAQPHGRRLVVESVRLPEEVAVLKREGALLWNVQAALPLRYDRTVVREASQHVLTLEQFRAQEAEEEALLGAVYPLADHEFINNASKTELFAQVDAVMKTVDSAVGK